MNHIPITFEHEGKRYNGFFNQVSGSGNTAAFHLYDTQNFFLGKLSKTNGWVFETTPTTEGFNQLADFFGDYITNWQKGGSSHF